MVHKDSTGSTNIADLDTMLRHIRDIIAQLKNVLPPSLISDILSLAGESSTKRRLTISDKSLQDVREHLEILEAFSTKFLALDKHMHYLRDWVQQRAQEGKIKPRIPYVVDTALSELHHWFLFELSTKPLPSKGPSSHALQDLFELDEHDLGSDEWVVILGHLASMVSQLSVAHGESTPYLVSAIERAEIARQRYKARVAEPSPESSTLPVAIYVSDAKFHPALEAAVDRVATSLSFELFTEELPEFGSWFRRKQYQTFDKNGISDRLKKTERALELLALHKPQAEVDSKQAEALASLLTALNVVPEAVVQIGSILVVKNDGVLIARNLTQLELYALERNPEWLREPASVLQSLQGVAEQAEAAGSDESHLAIRSLEPPAI